MFCMYCKVAREENEYPCRNCGAPSPLSKNQKLNDRNISGTAWTQSPPSSVDYSVPQLSFEDAFPASSPSGERQLDFPTPDEIPSVFWQQPDASLVSQQPFDSFGNRGAQIPFPADPPTTPPLDFNDPVDLPAQENFPTQENLPNAERSAMLPALYQPQLTGQQPTLSLQLVPAQAIQHFLPDFPEQEDGVHIPPTYTTPRPLLSRKRVINGFISVVIVISFLCVGSAYLVKDSGILRAVGIGRSISDIAPTPVPTLAEPLKNQVPGPAAANIPSSATSSRYDTKTLEPTLSVQDFTVNQTVYVTYTVQSIKQDGRVSAKWYTNNQIYYTQQSAVIKAKDLQANENRNGLFEMRFVNPAECKVELWWNNQLATTMYFVVR
jgi:hypothetical protein